MRRDIIAEASKVRSSTQLTKQNIKDRVALAEQQLRELSTLSMQNHYQDKQASQFRHKGDARGTKSKLSTFVDSTC